MESKSKAQKARSFCSLSRLPFYLKHYSFKTKYLPHVPLAGTRKFSVNLPAKLMFCISTTRGVYFVITLIGTS
jgi:hypothetical protein